MDILFLLIPLSVVLSLAVLGVLAWAVWSGQFEDMEGEGQRIFDAGETKADAVARPKRPGDGRA
jgi:cbb3-type cytochrome oxidase maturation protein